LPDATPFDTVAFVSGIRSLVHQAVALFGRAPYREYTFQFEDGAYSGGLEHRNSVTLGARSEELAHDPNSGVQETAHEFVHTWNLMPSGRSSIAISTTARSRPSPAFGSARG